MVCHITFLPEDVSIDVPEGTLISDAGIKAGVRISIPCGGSGRCGRCMVEIGDHGERVLACQTAVSDGMIITIPSEDHSRVIAAIDHKEEDIEELSPISQGFGLAVDIGTTTIAIEVVDLSSGKVVFKNADMNGQRIRGEDVLARIQYAEEGGTDELCRLVIETINRLIGECNVPGVSVKDIRSAYIAGNTAMTHLFLGVDPSPIRIPPFEPVFREAETTGSECGLNIADDARVICMPSVASYVGGDITSDIVDSGMDRAEGLALLIDVGTNGEVALGNAEMLLTCSSSAGPAFEGSQMTSGMLAKPGAIDSVRIIDGKVNYTVIGGIEPKGICGSGVIDLVAELFKAGMIDRRGNFTESASAVDGVFRIVGDVVITQSEIANIIMTKAAIYSASRTMIRNLGIDFNDLEKIYIAGGFGNFINMDSAVTIGLFPDVDRSKYEYLGNASLSGARHALVSEGFRMRVGEAFSKMTYIDLGSDPIFYDEYMSAQFLPHTDGSLFPTVI